MSKLMLNPEYNLYERNGSVYIIEINGLVKIGRSQNPSSRIKNIATACGRKIEKTYISPACSNYCEIESSMHSIYKDRRKGGEWFDVPFCEAVLMLESQTFEPIKARDEPTNPSESSDTQFQAYCDKKLADSLKEYPQISEYLERNGLRVFYSPEAKQILVTDDRSFAEDFTFFMEMFVAASCSGIWT